MFAVSQVSQGVHQGVVVVGFDEGVGEDDVLPGLGESDLVHGVAVLCKYSIFFAYMQNTAPKMTLNTRISSFPDLFLLFAIVF